MEREDLIDREKKLILIEYMKAFQTGQIKGHIREWIKLTLDKEVLLMVQGILLEFATYSKMPLY